MNEQVLQRMIDMLDIQQAHCISEGATVSANTLTCPKKGNTRQNHYYYGHLNMAQCLAWEIGKDIIKVNGKHLLIDEQS